MIHYNEVLDKAINVSKQFIVKEEQLEIDIIQDVYGKINIYLENGNDQILQQLERTVKEEIDSWLGYCGNCEENFFVGEQIQEWKKDSEPVCKGIWVFEKYLTNAYWDGKQRTDKKLELSSKLVSFYSFKGGVGRTTTMVMTAIALARKGKKIVVLDFDLEAPGVASLFPEDAMSRYGLLDFLLESHVYETEANVDEYMYPVGEYGHVNQAGGEIYIVPAIGSATREDTETYRKSLMRFDLDIPLYEDKKTPIDVLLTKIDNFVKPDYIFIDTRSGIHQIGGITLSRYSDLAMLFFYGSNQNVQGMKTTIPILKKENTPFVLLNVKVPVNAELAELEKKVYLEGSYEALGITNEEYRNGEIAIDDETGEHYPIDISYYAGLEVIQNTDQLIKVCNEQEYEIGKVVMAIEDALTEEDEHSYDKGDISQSLIIDSISQLIGKNETGAAEDEFTTESQLKADFYPLRSYSFIFDQKKFLVLGQKGVGKTALFTALKYNNYAKALAKYLQIDSEQYEHSEWIVGTSQETDYIDIFGNLKSEEQIRAFLYYETIRILLKNEPKLETFMDNDMQRKLLSGRFTSDKFCMLNGKMAFDLKELLNGINEYYEKQNKVVTIIYDALDRVVAAQDRGRFVSALVYMWYMNENTMHNIKSKIFLRKDIYDREVNVPDKVKLKNYSVTISWEYDQLFAMVWKRAISKNVEMKRLYEKVTGQEVSESDGLGYIPVLGKTENRNMLTAIIGMKMGSGNKASTYNWFHNRLADTQGIIVPRSMIDIFVSAAEEEKDLRAREHDQVYKSIIRPRCFEDMLPKVSIKRVIDLKEEYREYEKFFNTLQDSVQRTPVDERDLIMALENAGFDNPRDEITKLISIGIIKPYQRRMADPLRYHFPDIYIKGLGLQRMGMH